jgi:hypothetical protein
VDVSSGDISIAAEHTSKFFQLILTVSSYHCQIKTQTCDGQSNLPFHCACAAKGLSWWIPRKAVLKLWAYYVLIASLNDS